MTGSPMKMILTITLVSLSLAGCSKDSLCEGIYEGFRVQQRLEDAPEPLSRDEGPMTFEQYDSARKNSGDE